MEITEFVVRVEDRQLTCALAAPDAAHLQSQPALVLALGSTLKREQIAPATESFVAAGHYVLTFDLPNHGERANQYGEGLHGICAAMTAGQDALATCMVDGKTVIDACLARGIGTSGHIVTWGTSRNGYFAIRLAAEDARIQGAVGLAPVTDWRALTEFGPMRNTPQLAAAALDHWAARLAGRPVFMAIGNHDDRVGTDCCVRFALRLFEAEQPRYPVTSLHELHVVPQKGHTLSDEWRTAGAQWLLRLCPCG